MSITFYDRPSHNTANQLAILLLTVEVSAAIVIHAPSMPMVPTNLLLLGLFIVFALTIALCRMPLPPAIRAALIMGLVALILSVGAKSDPFRLSATNDAFSESTTDRDRMAALPVFTHVDNGRPTSSSRVLFNGTGGDALAARLDQGIGARAAGNLTISAEVSTFRDHGGGYSVIWSVGSGTASLRCGRLTLFTSHFDDSIAQMSKTFDSALNQSTQLARLACY